MKNALFFSILFFGCCSAGNAQRVLDPKPGSIERTALMNAIRTYDTARDRRNSTETFHVSAVRVEGMWAYVNVQPKLAAGTEIYGQAHVFLQKSGGKWRVAFSTYNDRSEVGVDGLARLRRRNRSFPKELAEFAMQYLAG